MKFELDDVMEVLLDFEWKDEHKLSLDKMMWLMFDIKFELLIHSLYEFEVPMPNIRYWK